jgi:uracil-DNA glycosylase
MGINSHLECNFPCGDVHHSWVIPHIDIDRKKVKILVISEAPPANKGDYYYGGKESLFNKTTCIAFNDAGHNGHSIDELIRQGIYFTTAIKCNKKGYLVSSSTLKKCSKILHAEIAQFPNIKVVMCMGDFAIKTINYIMKEKIGRPVIPSGSTYRIRSGQYIEDSVLYVPSYTQTGDSFNLEKSKRRMIAEDIRKAMRYLDEN